MRHDVKLSQHAIEDLIAIHRWIAQEGSAHTATAYIDRIEARCATLAEFPHRGAARDDLAPGLRTLSFERRVVIAYTVQGTSVQVLRVISGARDLPDVLG